MDEERYEDWIKRLDKMTPEEVDEEVEKVCHPVRYKVKLTWVGFMRGVRAIWADDFARVPLTISILFVVIGVAAQVVGLYTLSLFIPGGLMFFWLAWREVH